MTDIDNAAIEAAFSGGAGMPYGYARWWELEAWYKPDGGIEWRNRLSPSPLTLPTQTATLGLGELSDATKAAIRAALKGEAQP